MKRTFVQCAEIELAPEADPRAPGGAVTLSLCGNWDHSGPCRWPHETRAEWDDRRGQVRVIFLADEADEAQVRGEIERALAGGTCAGPEGKPSHWTVGAQTAGALSESESAWEASIPAERRGA
jgi:hypothetical protein